MIQRAAWLALLVSAMRIGTIAKSASICSVATYRKIIATMASIVTQQHPDALCRLRLSLLVSTLATRRSVCGHDGLAFGMTVGIRNQIGHRLDATGEGRHQAVVGVHADRLEHGGDQGEAAVLHLRGGAAARRKRGSANSSNPWRPTRGWSRARRWIRVVADQKAVERKAEAALKMLANGGGLMVRIPRLSGTRSSDQLVMTQMKGSANARSDIVDALQSRIGGRVDVGCQFAALPSNAAMLKEIHGHLVRLLRLRGSATHWRYRAEATPISWVRDKHNVDDITVQWLRQQICLVTCRPRKRW